MSAPRDEDRMTDQKQDERLMDHQYDDIQEFDNPLPTWWNVIFLATIVWSAIYLWNVIPGVGSGKGRTADYDAEMAKAQELYGSAEQQADVAIDEGAVAAALLDPAKLAAGKTVFASTCSPCHNMDGGGNIGPNLTDDYWIHGNSHQAILTTLVKGVPEKGMPAWSPALRPDQISAVAAYITTLRGTKPAVAKEPQGTLMTADGQSAAADSAAGQ